MVSVAAAYVEDVLLVDRCLTGEPAATRELFSRHKSRVHASLFRVLGTNRDMDDLMATMAEYFGAWTPASTTVCVNQLSTPGARVELDMIAVYPKT